MSVLYEKPRRPVLPASQAGDVQGQIPPHWCGGCGKEAFGKMLCTECEQEGEKMEKREVSPCVGCLRVADPDACDNKRCNYWQRWFLRRWSMINGYWEQQREKESGK